MEKLPHLARLHGHYNIGVDKSFLLQFAPYRRAHPEVIVNSRDSKVRQEKFMPNVQGNMVFDA